MRSFPLNSRVKLIKQIIARGTQTEDRSLATSRLAEVRQEIGEAEASRKELGSSRPAAVIQEALRGLEQDGKWAWSKKCQNATTAGERAFCKNYFNVKAEGARAAQLSLLETKIERLKGEARSYEEKGGGREADNQAAVLANLLGLRAIKVERGMTLFLAVLVEMGAALGLYLATGHMRQQPYAGAHSARGRLFVNAGPLIEVSEIKPASVPLKQIAGPARTAAPRRVRLRRISSA